jgi:hypothetical protein
MTEGVRIEDREEFGEFAGIGGRDPLGPSVRVYSQPTDQGAVVFVVFEK